MNCLDQYTQVVAEHLAEYLVELANIAFTPHGIPELRLNHAEGGLHIRPLVVVREELLPIVHEIVVHLCPDIVFLGHRRVDLEGDKRHGIRFGGRF